MLTSSARATGVHVLEQQSPKKEQGKGRRGTIREAKTLTTNYASVCNEE